MYIKCIDGSKAHAHDFDRIWLGCNERIHRHAQRQKKKKVPPKRTARFATPRVLPRISVVLRGLLIRTSVSPGRFFEIALVGLYMVTMLVVIVPVGGQKLAYRTGLTDA